MAKNKDQLININVIIADRPYPMKIKADEEENVRKAAKMVNGKLKEYQGLYEAKDKQDYLAMCALTFAVSQVQNENNTVISDESFSLKLDELDRLLSQSIS